jgi:predicted metalloprotease with PDZ domain
MTKKKFWQRFPFLIETLFLFSLLAPIAFGQSNQLQVNYTVAIADVDKQLFHVTTEIKNIKAPSINLSLPIWTPGWYTVENYAKNILRLKITDAQGNWVQPTMTRKQTWRVETKNLTQLKVEFDYQATILALNQAKISKDFAFFTGTQLFLEVSGYRDKPSTVRFELPQGWKIMSALKETADPLVFTAANFDELVDSPTEMGNFDVTKFEVEGKPHYFCATPAGSFAKEKADKFVEMLKKVYAAQSAIFNGLPYEKQLCFYFFAKPESNASGALEHSNSFVSFAPDGKVATPEMLIGTAAHEFFHTWNVKRIRPIQMYPYDYSRENETPLLWVSEGFTNYYTSKSLLRAGIGGPDRFLFSVTTAINGVESNEARKYISPADASTSTWLGYDTGTAFDISYYTQGQNLGALLDLSILNDTKGEFGLDEVMRSLYKDFYLKGKGFSSDDLLAIINRLSKRDYREFFKRYVFGVEVPPYNDILGFAGYQANRSSDKGEGYEIKEFANPTAEQMKVREAWVKMK